MNPQKKLAKTEIQLNRLLAEKAVISFREKHRQNNERKARTRTLIQMGGLLEITPLPSICDINLGDDLQIDHPDKAATLLGLLLHISEQIPEMAPPNDFEKFHKIGVNYLKKNAR
ncbi:MAG: conjugal transfer protein TraD [Holosporaceae bacterium]|jgi:Mg2+/Co2+ transporter CorB|nr:conjugal transfer protein TraD [Holosporaceae bacterium]